MSRVRYAACMLATQSARRPKWLEVLDVWDELSSHRIRSSGGACVRVPEGEGASKIAGLAVGTVGCTGAGVGAGVVKGVTIMCRGRAGGIRYLWGHSYGRGAHGGQEVCAKIAEGSVVGTTKPVSGGGGAIGAGFA